MTEVIIYTTNSCPFCSAAKEYLAKKGIGFTEINVSQDRNKAKEMIQINPKGSVPTMVVKGRVIVGFVPQLIDDALKRPRLPKREEITQNLLFDPFEQ
jgi:glutaredoxin-like YruB-family protein